MYIVTALLQFKVIALIYASVVVFCCFFIFIQYLLLEVMYVICSYYCSNIFHSTFTKGLDFNPQNASIFILSHIHASFCVLNADFILELMDHMYVHI